MSTVGTPGGPITPGCGVRSPTLAAGGIDSSSLSIDPHETARQGQAGAALDFRLCAAVDFDLRSGDLHARRAGHLDLTAATVDGHTVARRQADLAAGQSD